MTKPMTKPMTHLSAFLSDDGKRERIWTDGVNEYKRYDNELLTRNAATHWASSWQQVAAMTGEVHWADEPKRRTIDQREALETLLEGGLVAVFCKPRYIDYRLKDDCFNLEKLTADTPLGELVYNLGDLLRCCIAGHVSVVVPDPSQPANSGCTKCGAQEDVRPHSGSVRLCFSCGGAEQDEPPTKPPLKVGDRVRFTMSDKKELYGNVTRNEEAGKADVLWDGNGKPLTMTLSSAIEKIEASQAEPTVEELTDDGALCGIPLAPYTGKRFVVNDFTPGHLTLRIKDGDTEVARADVDGKGIALVAWTLSQWMTRNNVPWFQPHETAEERAQRSLTDALAEKHRLTHGPFTLAEAVASGRPFRRKGWVPELYADDIYDSECGHCELEGPVRFSFVRVDIENAFVEAEDVTATDFELMQEGGE